MTVHSHPVLNHAIPIFDMQVNMHQFCVCITKLSRTIGGHIYTNRKLVGRGPGISPWGLSIHGTTTPAIYIITSDRRQFEVYIWASLPFTHTHMHAHAQLNMKVPSRACTPWPWKGEGRGLKATHNHWSGIPICSTLTTIMAQHKKRGHLKWNFGSLVSFWSTNLIWLWNYWLKMCIPVPNVLCVTLPGKCTGEGAIPVS
jgi:hypothetical protein